MQDTYGKATYSMENLDTCMEYRVQLKEIW